MLIKMVGSMPKRDATNSVTIMAIRSAESSRKKYGVIIEISTQPGITSRILR